MDVKVCNKVVWEGQSHPPSWTALVLIDDPATPFMSVVAYRREDGTLYPHRSVVMGPNYNRVIKAWVEDAGDMPIEDLRNKAMPSMEAILSAPPTTGGGFVDRWLMAPSWLELTPPQGWAAISAQESVKYRIEAPAETGDLETVESQGEPLSTDAVHVSEDQLVLELGLTA